MNRREKIILKKNNKKQRSTGLVFATGEQNPPADPFVVVRFWSTFTCRWFNAASAGQ